MRWLDYDSDGNRYWNRNLPASAKLWTKSDFKTPGMEVFNYHFMHAGTARMTDLELKYLHALIEEFKDLSADSYRKLEIWRALNWAPVDEQFALVLPTKKELKKFVVDVEVNKKTTVISKRLVKKFSGVWVKPYSESVYGKNDENILSLYDITPPRPAFKYYPNAYKSSIKSIVPTFVLDRSQTGWDSTSGIIKPFNTDSDGNIISKINNLDSLILAKMTGKKYRGKEIPDQEIVHYIRRKYGFAHALPHSYDNESGLPLCYYYVIPFYDDESNKSLNLGEYIPKLDAGVGKEVLVDKTMTISEQIRQFNINLSIASARGFSSEYLNHDRIVSLTNVLIGMQIRDNKSLTNYLPTWNQIFHFSTIRAYWRASRILKETLRFTKYITEKIEKTKDVLIVSGEVGPTPNSEDFDDALTQGRGVENSSSLDREVKKSLFFMSGREDGRSNYNKSAYKDDDFRVSARIDVKKISENTDYHERPWNKIFKYSKEGKNAYSRDRNNVHRKNECFGTNQYMRNILIPNVAPYISDMLYDEKQNDYTRKALDTRALFYKPLWESQLNSSGLNLLEKKAVQVILGEPLETIKYSDFTNTLKKSKTAIFGTLMSFVIIVEILAARHTISHEVAHKLVLTTETLLTTFKVNLSLMINDYTKAAIDLGVFLSGWWLTNGVPLKPGGRPIFPGLSHGIGGAVSIVITFAVFLYDRWFYSKEKLQKMDEMVKLFNDATNLGVLEGPYAQTLGAVRIKKGTDGSIPINVKISPDGKTITTEYQNVQSTQTADRKESAEERRSRLNKEFLESGGTWETKFFKQLKEIECKTLLDIAKKTTQSDGRSNPVLNQAPNHIDVGAFRPKQSGKVNGINTKELKNLEVYFTFGLNDVNNLEQDWWSMSRDEFSENKDRVLNKNEITTVSSEKVYFTNFRYTRAYINNVSDLAPMIYGTIPATEKYAYFSGGETMNPNAIRVYRGEYNYKLPLTITDKEKVYLIRKKYGLDEVIPGGNCCSVFDHPVDRNIFPIKTNCQYLYDFTSTAFIKKLEEFCGKKEDKNKQNSDKSKASASDGFPATTHGITEELSVQHEIKLADATAENNRKDLKRKGTDGSPRYEGTADSTRNLGQLPRFGIQAVIPGNTDTFSLPMTDSESQQDIAFELIDTERSAAADLIANLVINYVGFTLSKLTYQIKENEGASTPLQPGKKTYEKIYYTSTRRIT
jgi:hypothetical protein